MSRLLFWIGLAFLVILAIRSKLRSAGLGGGTPAARTQGAERQPGQIESMACCAHCHVYFPVSEALQADGQVYCSPAHVRQPPL